MHSDVWHRFEELGRRHGVSGAVLEVGAVPSPDTLLELPCLRACTERVGINLDGPHAYAGYRIERGTAHDLGRWADGRFQAVVSNATLEHDPEFWRSLAEMHRVLAPGGLMMIGVPGYAEPEVGVARRWMRRLERRGWIGARGRGWLASTPVLVPHEGPGDFYRFSAQAVREVFLRGVEVLECVTLMVPPRIIGVGRKPAA
jgi:SAM-dependent methyltransferase